MTHTTEERPGDTDNLAILSGAEIAASALGIEEYAIAEGELIQQKIEEFLANRLQGVGEDKLGSRAPMTLGALWGMSLVMNFDWAWIMSIHGHWRSLGVSDPERRYLILPYDLFSGILEKKTPKPPHPRVLYELIAFNQLPPSRPNTYRILSE